MDDPDRPTARSISASLIDALWHASPSACFFHAEADGHAAVVVVEAWADGSINRETILPLDAAQVLIARLWSWQPNRADLRDLGDAIEAARDSVVWTARRAA